MALFTTYYFMGDSGRSPVEEFIDNELSADAQRKLFEKIGWLEEYGPRLPMPHSRKISGDIYELRVHREDANIRLLYFFFEGNKIVFVNGFKKKTNKTPPREIHLAEQRRADFLKQEGRP